MFLFFTIVSELEGGSGDEHEFSTCYNEIEASILVLLSLVNFLGCFPVKLSHFMYEVIQSQLRLTSLAKRFDSKPYTFLTGSQE